MSETPNLPLVLTVTGRTSWNYEDIEALRGHSTWEGLAGELTWDVAIHLTDEALIAVMPGLFLALENDPDLLESVCLSRFVPDPRIPHESPEAMARRFKGLDAEARAGLVSWFRTVAEEGENPRDRALARYGLAFWTATLAERGTETSRDAPQKWPLFPFPFASEREPAMSETPNLPLVLTRMHPDFSAHVEALRGHSTWEGLAGALSWDVAVFLNDEAFLALLPAFRLALDTRDRSLDDAFLRRFVPDPRIPEESPEAMAERYRGVGGETRGVLVRCLRTIAESDRTFADHRALALYGLAFWTGDRV